MQLKQKSLLRLTLIRRKSLIRLALLSLFFLTGCNTNKKNICDEKSNYNQIISFSFSKNELIKKNDESKIKLIDSYLDDIYGKSDSAEKNLYKLNDVITFFRYDFYSLDCDSISLVGYLSNGAINHLALKVAQKGIIDWKIKDKKLIIFCQIYPYDNQLKRVCSIDFNLKNSNYSLTIDDVDFEYYLERDNM
ncbi:MAG: hypothetical protein QM499_04140 [Flavobacteriaceae bacterium]